MFIWKAADKEEATGCAASIGLKKDDDAIEVIYKTLEAHHSCEAGGGVVEDLEHEIQILRGALSTLILMLYREGSLHGEPLSKILQAGN